MDIALSSLVSMGFDASDASAALEVCGGSAERAVEMILSGGVGGVGNVGDAGIDPRGGLVGNNGTPPTLVECSLSQYSTPGGRSACTCVALEAANSFLSLASQQANTQGAAESLLTPSFLSDALAAGGKIYSDIPREGAVEHMSAEEVLTNCPEFVSLRLLGAVRQGVLSSDLSSPLGFRAQIEGCLEDDSADRNQWTAILITKAPETVVCVIPPLNLGGSGRGYTLIDSHPRPQLGIQGAYAAIHANLWDLLQSLGCTFPPTNLDPDMGDIMAMMINSFDIYALQRKK